MSFISVIVPVYNVSEYVEQCINSILAQTYTDFEIIIVNDGSTDKSPQICDRLALLDNRIIVIHQNNQGVSIARNVGVTRANGEWLCFVDGDDYLHPKMLENFIQYMQESEADIYVCNYFIVLENGKQKPCQMFDSKLSEYIPPQKVTEACFKTNIDRKKCIGVPWGKLYKREFIIKNELSFVPNLKRNQDIVYNMFAFSKSNKICYCLFFGYYYRKWSESAVNKYTPDFDRTAKLYLKCVRDFLANNSKYSSLFIYCITNTFLECLKLQVFHYCNPKSVKENFIEFDKVCSNPDISIVYIDKSKLIVKQRILIFLFNNKLRCFTFIVFEAVRFIKKMLHKVI